MFEPLRQVHDKIILLSEQDKLDLEIAVELVKLISDVDEKLTSLQVRNEELNEDVLWWEANSKEHYDD